MKSTPTALTPDPVDSTLPLPQVSPLEATASMEITTELKTVHALGSPSVPPTTLLDSPPQEEKLFPDLENPTMDKLDTESTPEINLPLESNLTQPIPPQRKTHKNQASKTKVDPLRLALKQTAPRMRLPPPLKQPRKNLDPGVIPLEW